MQSSSTTVSPQISLYLVIQAQSKSVTISHSWELILGTYNGISAGDFYSEDLTSVGVTGEIAREERIGSWLTWLVERTMNDRIYRRVSCVFDRDLGAEPTQLSSPVSGASAPIRRGDSRREVHVRGPVAS